MKAEAMKEPISLNPACDEKMAFDQNIKSS